MCNRLGARACSAFAASRGSTGAPSLTLQTSSHLSHISLPPPSAMPKRTGFTAWYDRLISSFSIEDLFIRKRPPGPPRTIFINEPLPEEYYDKKQRVLREHQFYSNQVITSKYTLITFLPRNLLEQYRRVANVYATPSLRILFAHHLHVDFSPSSSFSNSSPSLLRSLLAWPFFPWPLSSA
jgi:hypothetical protein